MSAKFNLLQCNPKTLLKTRTTCLPYHSLNKLRNEWNKRNPDRAIPTSVRTKDALWSELRKRMRNSCDTEFCVVNTLGMGMDMDMDMTKQSNDSRAKHTKTRKKNRAMSEYFRPQKPLAWIDNPTEWQDSTTISEVLQQYEDAYPTFEFIGPVPNDFASSGSWGACISEELCNLDLASLSHSGTKNIGIVFNLDPHDKPGSHWVCAFIDISNSAFYYYDSYGMEPNAEIKRLMRRCREQGCSRLIWNDIRHQRKETECGTYCLYVIISLLQGQKFENICAHRVDDDTINALRDILFATVNPRKGPTILKAMSLVRAQ